MPAPLYEAVGDARHLCISCPRKSWARGSPPSARCRTGSATRAVLTWTRSPKRSAARSTACELTRRPLDEALRVALVARRSLPLRLYWYSKGMARISTKNQVTIPVAALEEAGLHAGDQ